MENPPTPTVEKTPAEETIETVLDQSAGELDQLKEESLRKPENEKLKERIEQTIKMTDSLRAELNNLRAELAGAVSSNPNQVRGSESMGAATLAEENVTRATDQPRHIDSQGFVHYGERPDPHDIDPDWTR